MNNDILLDDKKVGSIEENEDGQFEIHDVYGEQAGHLAYKSREQAEEHVTGHLEWLAHVASRDNVVHGFTQMAKGHIEKYKNLLSNT
jgi:uncharacterized protein with HEPN domain